MLKQYVYRFKTAVKYKGALGIITLTDGKKFYLQKEKGFTYISTRKNGPWLKLSEASVNKLKTRMKKVSAVVSPVKHKVDPKIQALIDQLHPKKATSFKSRSKLKAFYSPNTAKDFIRYVKKLIKPILDNRTDQPLKTLVIDPSGWALEFSLILGGTKREPVVLDVKFKINTYVHAISLLIEVIKYTKNPTLIKNSQVVKDLHKVYLKLLDYMSRTYGLVYDNEDREGVFRYNDRTGYALNFIRKFQPLETK